MRYIDIERLARPEGWEERAERALNDLRREITESERLAEENGLDREEARRNAITTGLRSKRRQRIWRELSAALGRLSREKCWYSECRNPGSDKDVDHFRPKASVSEAAEHEGYWWLAFDWRNYRYACQWCNQTRNNGEGHTTGGKSDQFPLRPGSFRAQQEGDPHDDELPMLLDPGDPEDWKLLTFRPDGLPIPTEDEGSIDHERARVSIEVYHLHCRPMVEGRRWLAGAIERLVQEMELLRPAITEEPKEKTYKRRLCDLLRMIDKDAEYSAAALAYARGEVFKSERGHQRRRTWLEEILNSNT